MVDGPLIREIFDALEVNDDLPKSWRDAKHTVFRKVFGSKAERKRRLRRRVMGVTVC